ncbi:MAG: hypothetical protein CMH55_05885 [Myxococcales bacterium]|nr:hypothetical protein [Myxococcales bacterium]
MSDFSMFFNMGGVWMYAVSLFLVLSLVASCVLAGLQLSGKSIRPWLWCIAPCAAYAVGLLGRITGQGAVQEAAAEAYADQVSSLAHNGLSIALHPEIYGAGGVALVFFFTALVALGLFLVARHRGTDDQAVAVVLRGAGPGHRSEGMLLLRLFISCLFMAMLATWRWHALVIGQQLHEAFAMAAPDMLVGRVEALWAQSSGGHQVGWISVVCLMLLSVALMIWRGKNDGLSPKESLRKTREYSLWGIPLVLLLALGAYSSSLSSSFGLETSVAAAKAAWELEQSEIKQAKEEKKALSPLDAIKAPKLIRGAPPPEDPSPEESRNPLLKSDSERLMDLQSALENVTGVAVPVDAGPVAG